MINVKYDNDRVQRNAPFSKQYPGDAAFDLYNASDDTITVMPHSSISVPCGVSIGLPAGTFAMIVARSSTFTKRGLFVVGGLIDNGYTGPLYTIVWNPCLDGREHPIMIKPWERVSQLVLYSMPYITAVDVNIVTELPHRCRGNKGFGSSGM